MNKKIFVIVAASVSVAILASLVGITTVLGKNLNLPPGAHGISYYSSGHAVIDLPNPLPANYPATATKIYIGVFHDEIPNAGFECDRFYIQFYMKRPGATQYAWNPYAEIVANSEMADFLRIFWRGTPIAFDATLYGAPASYGTNNVILVSDDVVNVERHGNSLHVNLAAPQQVKIANTAGTFFTLPALSMELKAYGASTHTESTTVLKGYPGAWGGNYTVEAMGFNANGALTCSAWNLNAAPMSEGSLTMHGIQTFYPPP
jgi:hypothetical protein